MKIIKSIQELRDTLKTFRREGKTIGLVPTMGALHRGHASLIDASSARADITVVSVFVNPIQFGKNEDLDKYPRRLEADSELANAHGASIIFAPTVEEMYPNGEPETYVRNKPLESLYCGSYRPGHFRGVLTVVAKLFLICLPDFAFFGEKDYQQVFLIEEMVRTLNFPVEIVRVPIVREESGLALSSRNEYLSEEERKNALSIHQGLLAAKSAYLAGERSVTKLRNLVIQPILLNRGSVQYVEIVSASTLEKKVGHLGNEKLVILLAAFFGKTRLIDNIELEMV